MANAILCVVGVGLVFSGCWFLTQHSEREPKIEAFNLAVEDWNATERAAFAASRFRVLFKSCATCDPLLAISLTENENLEAFDAMEREHVAERASYMPLRYSSRSITANEIRQGQAVVGSPVEVAVEITTAKGDVQRLPATEPLSLYSIEAGHGNEKVCRNERGEYIGGRCYFRWFLRSMCFSVVEVAGQWLFDPDTPNLGCDVSDNWAFAQYAKDIQHSNRLENGDFTFGITVRHGNDPMLIARDVTNKQRPNFGDSAQELKTEGWVTLGFGLLVLSAPGFQIYCNWKERRDWEQAQYGEVREQELSGLMSEAREGNWLGRAPNLPNPLNIV